MTIDIRIKTGFDWHAADTFICIDKASDISADPLCYLYIGNYEPRINRRDTYAAQKLIYKEFIRFYEALQPDYKLWCLSSWKREKPLNRIDHYRIRKEREAGADSAKSGKSIRYEFDEPDALVFFAAWDISDRHMTDSETYSAHDLLMLMILPNNANVDEIVRDGWNEMRRIVATFSWDFAFIRKIVEAGGMLTKPVGCNDNDDTYGMLGIGAASILNKPSKHSVS